MPEPARDDAIRMLTIADVATMLSVTQGYVRRELIEHNRIRYIRLPGTGHYRIHSDSVQQLLGIVEKQARRGPAQVRNAEAAMRRLGVLD